MSHKILIGIDFSINKPAACIFKNNQYIFISWPYDLSKPQKKIYKEAPITIIERADLKNNSNCISDKFRYEIKNSKYLANLILDTIFPYIKQTNKHQVYIAFEGLSYGSSGNFIVQLGGYKYILMDTLSHFIPFENMFTYAPMTIKKTAGCSKKGMSKSDMIEAFKNNGTLFGNYILNNENAFKTKFNNWITHLDDIVDAYYVLETLKHSLQI